MAPAPAPTGPAAVSRARRRRRARTAHAQRRLAWLLCAPAVLVMVAVTAAPLGYAGWLSLQRYDLRFPDRRAFVGLGNYATVLTSPTFWGDAAATATITVFAVVAVLLLAAFAQVPEELLETARVDGATAWQRLTRVLLPAVRPVVLVVLLYRILDSIRVFDPVFIQTRGANGTETLSLLAYDQLVDRLNLGLGSTVSVLLAALVAGIALGFLV